MLYFRNVNGTRTSKPMFPGVWHANTEVDSSSYTYKRRLQKENPKCIGPQLTIIDTTDVCLTFPPLVTLIRATWSSLFSDVKHKVLRVFKIYIWTDSLSVGLNTSWMYASYPEYTYHGYTCHGYIHHGFIHHGYLHHTSKILSLKGGQSPAAPLPAFGKEQPASKPSAAFFARSFWVQQHL